MQAVKALIHDGAAIITFRFLLQVHVARFHWLNLYAYDLSYVRLAFIG